MPLCLAGHSGRPYALCCAATVPFSTTGLTHFGAQSIMRTAFAATRCKRQEERTMTTQKYRVRHRIGNATRKLEPIAVRLWTAVQRVFGATARSSLLPAAGGKHA